MAGCDSRAGAEKMFTQCPQCQVAFRITAEVLQQARGQVRCGSCDSAFNALDHLFEEPPTAAPGDSETGGDERSQALLQTLNRLAGPDEVRIEDTGVEWLVVDEDDVQPDETGPAGDTAATGSIRWVLEENGDDMAPPLPEVSDQVSGQASAVEFDPETADTAEQPVIDEQAAKALESAAEPEEARYDDNTPLPDDFEEQHNYVPAAQAPMRRATDVLPDNDDAQTELELSEPGDWMDLLDEFATGKADPSSGETAPEPSDTSSPDETTAAVPPAAPSAASELPLDVEEELAAIHGELSTFSESAGEDADDVSLQVDDDDLDITLDGEPVPGDPQAAGDEQTGNASGEDVSIVASQLDELLEAMGSGKFRSPDVTGAAEAERGHDEPAAADTDGHKDDAHDADAEPLTLASDDLPADLEIADETGAEANEPVAADLLPGADEAAADETSADESPNEISADEPGEADTESDEAEGDPIVYEESTGEFERAIADAEGEILAAASADAEADDDTDEADGDVVDLELVAAEDDEPGDGKEAAPALTDEADEADDADADAGQPADAADDIAAMTGNMKIDANLLRAMQDGNIDASMIDEDGSPIVETIVMEGDFVRGALHGDEDEDNFTSEQQKPKGDLPDPGSLIDTYISNRDPETRPGLFSGKRAIAGAVLLLMLLVGQFLHSSRESLATSALFNQTLGPVYRMFGDPVTPTWNIKGWQFEATSGSTNETDSLLTVSSRISNRSEQPLPYPLVHISLTDRYEEIMGSKVLEPGEYLAGNADPSRPVAPGDSFTAVISIASPAEEATGFKLNVCYRVVPGRVRCAVEDFKAP